MSKALPLDHYRLLGSSGLRVSPFCLGTMTFGSDWGWGADEGESRRQFDYYSDHGGNFIDTANFYTDGTSEEMLGRFLLEKRDRYVLATKYTLNMHPGDPNAGGNHRKSLMQSLEASLRRLNTDYVDLYWVHMFDFMTPIEETMRALDDAVRQGKVLYVGVSDFPAWKVAQANVLAEFRGWSKFVALQVEYSLIERTAERDLIPMANDLGLGVTPWSPLGQGVLSGKYTEADLSGETRGEGRHSRVAASGRLSARTLEIANEAKAIGKEIGISASQVSLAWLFRKPGDCSPILGARTFDQLKDSLNALNVELSAAQNARLEEASRISLGFPHEFLAGDTVKGFISGGTKVVPR